jgi:hypothetical protein
MDEQKAVLGLVRLSSSADVTAMGDFGPFLLDYDCHYFGNIN